MFNLNLLNIVLVPIMTLLAMLAFNYLSHKNEKKTLEITSESMAYERVDFLTNEVNKLKADLESATEEIEKLKTSSRRRDIDLLEAERLKNVALSEVTRLLIENSGLVKENQALRDKLTHYERDI